MTAYQIKVKTAHEEITRDYTNLDEVWNVLDSLSMHSHSNLLPIADNPIIWVATKDIINITLTGVDAATLKRYRYEQAAAEQLEKSRAYEAQYGNQIGAASNSALIGGMNRGIL